MGVWIETLAANTVTNTLKSHSAWVCGLKPASTLSPITGLVTLCVGVWIETWWYYCCWCVSCVTLCVGVWIETFITNKYTGARMSHSAWVCGLKPLMSCKVLHSECHTLRGCVDWNGSDISAYSGRIVTLCVGVWIETVNSTHVVYPFLSHTLRGCVDWNVKILIQYLLSLRSHSAWVCGLKLQQLASEKSELTSHSAWVCGLKQYCYLHIA